MKLRRPISAPLMAFFDGFGFLLILTPHTYANYGASFARNAWYCKVYAENLNRNPGIPAETLIGGNCLSKSRNHSRNDETCSKNCDRDVYREHCLCLNLIDGLDNIR